MLSEVTKNYPIADAAILCAAVSDFTPEEVAAQKIKRTDVQLELRLKPTSDIASTLGRTKRTDQRLIIFALETENEEANALRKLEKKNADFVVLNSTQNPGTTFKSDDNQITIISKKGKKSYEKKSKNEVASDIIDELALIL